MLFLAGLSATLGVASLRIETAILDEDTWVATSKAIVNNPQVQNDVANEIATQVMDLVGVNNFVASVLPELLSGFSGSLTNKVTELVADATVQVVRTDGFVKVLEAAIRATHDEFVRAVDGSTRFTIDSKGLSLNVGPSLTEIQKQLQQRGIYVLDNLDTSSINLMILLVDAPGLEQIKTWVHTLRVGSIVFPAFAVLSAIGGLLIARRRWIAVIAGAIGALVGAVSIRVLASGGRNQAIEDITGGVIGVDSAKVIVDEGLSVLNRILLDISVIAVIVLVVISAAAVASARRRSGRSSDIDRLSA